MSIMRFLPEPLKEKIRLRAGTITQRSRLLNLRQAGFAPARIIDAGAFRGEWSALAREIFPEARLLLIEPQPHLESHLRKVCAQLGQASLHSTLLGSTPATARFAISASNSRIVPSGYYSADETIIELPVRRLEDIAAETAFSNAEFLKLDLQGHELAALSGAGPLFGRAEVILIEVSLIPIGRAPLIADIIAKFSKNDYRLYDIFGANYRPLDRALWQTDLVFVRHDSPLIASSEWA